MRQPKPMNRLLQGDVGSGKTAVAAYRMLATAATTVLKDKTEDGNSSMSAAGRFQAAIMAPTELLARQHYSTLSSLLAERGSALRVGLLVGGQRVTERRKLLQNIQSGDVQLVVGTQSADL